MPVVKKRLKMDETGTLHCSKCGSTSFVRKRQLGGKVLLGVFAPKHMRCAACGKSHRRRSAKRG